MIEKRHYKRLDLFSTLAVFGVLAVLAFECFFVFELYNRDLDQLRRSLPAALQDIMPVPEDVEEPAPVG